MEAGDAKQILVDLGGLTSIGSDGLNMLIDANAPRRQPAAAARCTRAGATDLRNDRAAVAPAIHGASSNAPHGNAPLAEHKSLVVHAGERQALARG